MEPSQRFWGALVWVLVCFFAGCGGGELDSYGCKSDDECKHGRVCIAGQCQDSSGTCSDNDDCPAGQSCYQGHCLFCDQDSDGYFHARCAGNDCDDTNSSIHPGAQELCGDQIDNDCDQVIDPASLCGENCEGVSCPDGFACDPATGQCVPICTPDCAGKECGPDGCGGTCGRCPTGTRCDNSGRCVAGCEDLCTEPGNSVCSGNGVITCRDTNNDGCVEWSSPVPCPAGTRCQNGECVGCEPDCQGKECGDDGCGGTCGTCPPGTYCDDGRCLPGCRDECEWGQTRCADSFSYFECGEWDGDPCTEYSSRLPCPEGTVCDQSTGRCSGSCRDECFWGERYCWDEISYVECADWDGDGCTEFGPPMECYEGYCDWETGTCSGECWDECMWGESYCWDDMSYVECGEWDGDYCTEFSPPMPCMDNSYCDWDIGRCAGECYDDCWYDEFYCLSPREYIECGQYDNDECLDFSPPQRCPGRTRCSEQYRTCVETTCQDDCYEGMIECWDDWTFIDCGQYDDDPCLDWSPYPMSCPPETRCDWNVGECVPYQDCQLDIYEPDNYSSDATPVIPYEPQVHSLCPSGDDDWWLFTLDAPSEVLLETFGSYGDTVMWLYDAGLDQVAYDDDGGSDLFSRIQRDSLPAGRYYVQVQEFSDYGIIETYYLHLTVATSCIPDCAGIECGPDPVCGLSCGTCPAGWVCTPEGQCSWDGHREGAGDPCGFYTGCPADWNAAYTCIEFPGGYEGICSYPCQDADECAVDFPNGCCRELADGYRVCLPGELCNVQAPGYLDSCDFECLPDMFCLQGSSGGYEDFCIFTCDLAMGVCPLSGTCLDPGENSTTGFCLPVGEGEFGEPCTLAEGCQSGLVCVQMDADHPGYCNRLCSSMFPCPGPFECIVPDGQGGQWCAAPCFGPADCAILGDWSCLTFDGNMGVCVPN